MIKFKFRRGVAKDVRQELRKVAKLLPKISPAKHTIPVEVYVEDLVPDKDLDDVEGVFAGGAWRVTEFKIAAGVAEIDPFLPHRLGLKRLVLVFLHEWAHYEQWRDHKGLKERGVEVRARSLYNKLRDIGYNN